MSDGAITGLKIEDLPQSLQVLYGVLLIYLMSEEICITPELWIPFRLKLVCSSI